MKDDRVLVPAVAMDNIIDRGGFRTPAAELPMLAALLWGKPAIIDHAMKDVEGNWGRIVETGAKQVTAPPDLGEDDRAIVAAEGYWQILCSIAVAPDHPYLRDFDYESKSELSITFLYSDIRCPGCDCGKAIWARECKRESWSEPWLERCGVVDAFEGSLVCVPAVKSARVLSRVGEGLVMEQ